MYYYTSLLMLKSGLLIQCMYPKGNPHHRSQVKSLAAIQGGGHGYSPQPTIFMLLMLYLSTTFINFHRAVQFTVHLTLPVCSHHSHQARL